MAAPVYRDTAREKCCVSLGIGLCKSVDNQICVHAYEPTAHSLTHTHTHTHTLSLSLSHTYTHIGGFSSCKIFLTVNLREFYEISTYVGIRRVDYDFMWIHKHTVPPPLLPLKGKCWQAAWIEQVLSVLPVTLAFQHNELQAAVSRILPGRGLIVTRLGVCFQHCSRAFSTLVHTTHR